MGNLATSFDSVKKQSEQGVEANHTFQKIKNEGLQSALSNVLSARNIDVQIDERGILLRKYNYDLDDYDQHQMKLINRNIVMTDDGWDHAKLAIGLGRYNDELMYGVWADLLVGDLIVGKELIIKNEDEQGHSSVTINKDGIIIKNGSISWDNVKPPEISQIDGLSKELSSIKATTDAVKNSIIPEKIAELDQKVAQYLTRGAHTSIGEDYMISPYIGGGYLNIISGDNQVVIDPSNTSNTGYIFQVKNQDKVMVGINANGEALFEGEIKSTQGDIGGWKISDKNIYLDKTKDEVDYRFEIDSENLSISSKKTRSDYWIHESGTIYTFHYHETISIESGALKLSHSTFVDDNTFPLEEDFLLLTEGSLTIESDGKEHCYIDKYGIKERGKYLTNLYGVVKTGENSLTGGNNPWELQRADFGVVYDSPPLVNVMFYGTLPDHENIVFREYIGDSENGYTGFVYAVRTEDAGFNYSTKWWAVGNVRP